MANKVYVQFEMDSGGNARKVLSEIDRQMSGLGRTSQQTGTQIDSLIGTFKAAVVVEFFRQSAQAAFNFGVTAVEAYNNARAARLALEAVSANQGFAPGQAAQAVAQLPSVQKGLIAPDIAQGAIRNLLSMNFTLEESITLLKGMTDIASVARQSHLSLGEAISYGAEGLKNMNSVQYDGIGISENLAAQFKRLGIDQAQLTDATDAGNRARQIFINDFLKQVSPFAGQSEEALQGLQGATTQLNAAYQSLLVTVGEQISKNPQLASGVSDLVTATSTLAKEIGTEGSGANQALQTVVNLFGQAAKSGAFLLETVRELAPAFKVLVEGSGIGLLIRATGGNDKGTQLIREAQVAQNNLQIAFNNARNQPARFADIDRQSTKSAQRQIDALQASATAFKDARQKSIDEDRKTEAAQVQSLAKLQTNAINTVTDIRNQINSIDPFGGMFEAARRRQATFLEQFKDVPKSIKADFDRLNQELLALDIFKGKLAFGTRLNDLITEQAKLQAGLGGQGLRDEAANRESRRDEIERQIREAQQIGDITTQRKLLEEFDKTFAADKLQAVLREAVDRQVSTAQSVLQTATTATQRGLALDQILSATSNIGGLTEDQRAARESALAQNIGIQGEIAAMRETQMQIEIASRKANTDANAANTQALLASTNIMAELKEVFRDEIGRLLSSDSLIRIEAPENATVSQRPTRVR